MDIVREQEIPVCVPALIQQRGLEVQELLDLHPQVGIDEETVGYPQQLLLGGNGSHRDSFVVRIGRTTSGPVS